MATMALSCYKKKQSCRPTVLYPAKLTKKIRKVRTPLRPEPLGAWKEVTHMERNDRKRSHQKFSI